LGRFPGAQQGILQRVHERRKLGLIPEKDYEPAVLFNKVAKSIVGVHGSSVAASEPRIIHTCPDPVKELLGPHAHAHAEQLKKLFPFTNNVFFECGASREEVGKWFTEQERKFTQSWHIEIDAKRWDACVTKEALQFSIDQFKLWGLKGKPLRVLELQLKDLYCKSRKGVIATCPPQMRTGWPNTTDTNSEVSSAIFLSACARLGIPLESIALIFRGDDMFGYAPPEYHESIIEYYKAAGFIPKVKCGHPLEQCRFCSCMLLRDNVNNVVVSPQLKASLNLFLCLKKLPKNQTKRNAEAAQLRLGTAKGLINHVSHLPVFGDLVQSVIDNTNIKENAIGKNEQRNTTLKWSTSNQPTPSDSTFTIQIARMLQLPIDTIEQCQKDVARCKGSPGVMYTPALQLFAKAVYLLEG